MPAAAISAARAACERAEDGNRLGTKTDRMSMDRFSSPTQSSPALVSVIIAARDAGDSIGTAISSALQQSVAPLEVIVVDDASMDDTASVVARLGERDPRLKLIRLGENVGPGGARNRALAEASGVWIAPLDADDAFAAADRLERLIWVAESRCVDMIADNVLLVDAVSCKELGVAFPMADQRAALSIGPDSFIDSNALTRMRLGWGYLKPIIRSTMLRAHHLGYRDDLRVGEDYAFYLDCLLAGATWLLVAEPGYRYVMKSGSASHRCSRDDLAALTQHNRALLRASDSWPAEVDAALRRRDRDLDDAIAHFDCLTHLKRGRLVQVMHRLARRPRVALLLAESVQQAVMKRLGLMRRHEIRPAKRVGA